MYAWIIAVVLAAGAALLAWLETRDWSATGLAAAVGFFGGLIVNAGVFYFWMPIFVHILDGATVTFAILNLLLLLAAGWIGTTLARYSEKEYLTIYVPVIMIVVILAISLVGNIFVVEPVICSEPDHRDLAGLWMLESATAEFHDTDPNKLLKVSPDHALAKAKSVMPARLGSWLEVGSANLQLVNGHPFYIIDLKVADGQWRAFTRNNSVVPGYIVVDALDKDTQAQFRDRDANGEKIEMKIVDSARFLYDFELERYAYRNYFVSHGYHYDDLGSLEVDDEWRPFYTATLKRYSIGHTGYSVEGVMVLDPQTGEIEDHEVGDTPGWVDIVFTKGVVEDFAQWWGQFHQAQICSLWNRAGKFKVDQVNDVFTGDGELWYQVTMTSEGSDTALTHVAYVQPRIGQSVMYNVDGRGFKTITAIDDLMDNASMRLKAEGFEPVEVELQRIGGEFVYYGILNTRSTGDAMGSYAGVAAVRAADATEEGDVVVAGSVRELDLGLRKARQSAQRDNPEMSEESMTLDVKGTVVRATYNYTLEVYQLIVESRSVSGMRQTWKLQGPGDVENLAFVRDGDTVSAVVYQGERSEWLDIRAITYR